ncbi:hypothetical protein ABDK56_02545 [Sphingomonas sp. ASV193]|uniref:hypothetical protein n=1 Tax=Sphingomonas sp. ASV193 TaxID=3144405 RepID=UPI0032E850E3
MSALRMAVAAALLSVPAMAGAKPISDKDVISGKVRLDQTLGYILISGDNRQSGVFLRVPDAETRKTYEADRLKAFAKAHQKYVQAIQASSATPVAEGTDLEEPKLDSFTIDPIELRDAESFGPMFAYSKDTRLHYLQSVKPGTYIWYGPIMVAGGPGTGSCNCMGSVRFEVKPGVVTDLGTSLVDLPRWQDDKDVARLQLDQTNAKRVAAGKEPLKAPSSGEVHYGLPDSLAAWPSVRPAFQASGKMNNYYGATVTRLAPIPGVLAYHRDVVVDARTGVEIANETLVSRARIKK